MQKWTVNMVAATIGKVIMVIFLAASSVNAECPDGIISLWALDERDGDIFEDSVDGNNGLGSLSPAPTTGKVNGAQDFDGTDVRINIMADGSFNWGSDVSFSIEYWIMRSDSAFSANEVVMGRDDGAISEMHWWTGLWTDGKAAFVLVDIDGTGFGSRANGEYLEGNDDLTDGIWHHVAVVRDSATNENRLYVDGVLNDSISIDYDPGGGFGSETSNLNMGWLNLGGGFNYNGVLDEVAIYNRVLTADEITQHFDDGISYCDSATPPADEDGGGGGGGGGCFVNSLKY